MAYFTCTICGKSKYGTYSGALFQMRANNRPLICGTCTRRIREKAASDRRGSV